MLYPQNGDRIITIDSVTSLHPVYPLSSCHLASLALNCCVCMYVLDLIMSIHLSVFYTLQSVPKRDQANDIRLSLLSTRATSTQGDRAFPVLLLERGVECSAVVCSFCAIIAAAVPPRPQDGTVSVIVLFTVVSSCVTDCNR